MASGEVHVRWSATRAGPVATWPEAWLDDVESARLRRLRQLDDQWRFVVSRHLLKTLVGELTGCWPGAVRLDYRCQRCGQNHGRAMVTGPPAALGWHVSIAHAGERVLVTAADAGPVGIDVEPVERVDFTGFDEVALTKDERDRVRALPPEEQGAARAALWTGKEAFLKATGRGLRTEPSQLALGVVPGQLLEVDVGRRFAAAVAVLTEQPALVRALEVSVGASAGRADPARRATV